MKWFALFALLLTGCASYIQDRNIARQHRYNALYLSPLAQDCNQFFPVKDSVGKPIFTSATNINYTGEIDSLEVLIRRLSVDNANKTVIFAPGNEAVITQLQQKIAALKAAYKPCKPDTVKIPIYRVDEAAVKVWQDKYRAKADSLITQNTNLATSNKNKSVWRWIALGCMGLITVSVVWKVYKFVNPLPKVV